MTARDSWATQAAGAGIIDVEDARVAMGAMWMPGSSGIVARSGFRPGAGTSPGLVTATGTPDANVHVAPFQLVLQTVRATTGGPYIVTLDAIFDVNVLSTPADPTNPRNDLIIAQQSDTFYGDGVSTWVIRQVVGTPAGSPADPAVSGSGDYVPLARVRVNAGVTTITGAVITDLRTSGHAKSLPAGLNTVAAGGILPVTSAAERNAIAGKYPGLTVWRTDLNRIEMWDGAAWRSTTPHQQRLTVTAGTLASVVFSGIPTNLRQLAVSWTARSDAAAASAGMQMRVNGDATAQYDSEYVRGTVAVLSGATATAVTFVDIGPIPAATTAAGVFSSGVINFVGWDSPHANNLGFSYQAQAQKLNGIGNISQHGGGDYTAAGPYTSVTLFPSAGLFVAGSDFQIMGWE
jgi:hypothetical protein